MTDTDPKPKTIVERPVTDPTHWRPKWFAILETSQYWCDWRLIQCGVWDTDGTPLHYGEGCYPSEECTDIERAQPTLSGHIKWDGCMEFSTGGDADGDMGTVHVCDGARSVVEVMGAWLWLLSEAHAAMVKAGATGLMWEPVKVTEPS